VTSTNVKIEALAAHLKGALEGVRSGVSVETRYRRATETGRNRGDQRAVFGDPIYYLEVLPASVSPVDRDPSGTFGRRAHDLQAVLLWQYTDADTRSGSSQVVFNQLLDAMYDAAAEGWLQTDEGPQTMQPGEAQHQFTALDSRGETVAHELTFTVTLTDQHQ